MLSPRPDEIKYIVGLDFLERESRGGGGGGGVSTPFDPEDNLEH